MEKRLVKNREKAKLDLGNGLNIGNVQLLSTSIDSFFCQLNKQNVIF